MSRKISFVPRLRVFAPAGTRRPGIAAHHAACPLAARGSPCVAGGHPCQMPAAGRNRKNRTRQQTLYHGPTVSRDILATLLLRRNHSDLLHHRQQPREPPAAPPSAPAVDSTPTAQECLNVLTNAPGFRLHTPQDSQHSRCRFHLVQLDRVNEAAASPKAEGSSCLIEPYASVSSLFLHTIISTERPDNQFICSRHACASSYRKSLTRACAYA